MVHWIFREKRKKLLVFFVFSDLDVCVLKLKTLIINFLENLCSCKTVWHCFFNKNNNIAPLKSPSNSLQTMEIVIISIVILVFGYLFTDDLRHRSAQATPVISPDVAVPPTQRNYSQYHGRRRRSGGYRGGEPLFSPDKKHIWDGEDWIRNDGGFNSGFFIGLLLGAIALALVLFN